MPGAGVKTENIAEIIRITGATEFHASAKHPVKSEMEFRKPELSMGTSADEFSYDLTDAATVKRLIQLANSNK
ncbi:copper homeostasis protein CutC [compost metagenome]